MLRQLQFGILGLEKQRGLDVCSNGLCLYGTEHNEKSSIVRIHQNAEAEIHVRDDLELRNWMGHGH